MTKLKFKRIKKFFSQFPSKKYSRGDIILKPGEKFENIYFIKTGYARAYTSSPKGENTIYIFKPLFMMSVLHFVAQHPNNYYFQAISPVEVYIAPRSEFKKYLDANHDLSLAIMDFFFTSLLNYFENQGNIINGTAQNKIASVLLQLTQDYGDIKKNQLVVNFPATHRILANIVGLTRETTSIQMSRFQKKGIISTKRLRFFVNDLKKLKEMALSLD